MEFIREKIKEKPINKRKILIKVGVAALCGLVFALVVCIMLIIAVPLILPAETQGTQSTEQDSQNESITDSTEETEGPGEVIVLPPNLDMSLSDYETLQNELYEIGNRVNKSIVTVVKMNDGDDWTSKDTSLEGRGSGVIVSEDSNYIYILTEQKIIAEAEQIRVSFIDGTEAEATLLKCDGNTGLSMITVEKRLLKPETKRAISVAQLDCVNKVNNGALVIALGSPLGSNYSISTGNITSVENEVVTKDRNYSIYTTDILASKNGSGVLVNTKGSVVGFIIQDYCGAQDVSTVTAISMREIDWLIQRLKNGKDIPYVGLYLSTVTDDIAEEYDIPKGVYIKEVIADSPAMIAGLQNGDVITHINGEVVVSDMRFSEKIAQLIPGTNCEIFVKRQNGNEYYEIKYTITIGVLE